MAPVRFLYGLLKIAALTSVDIILYLGMSSCGMFNINRLISCVNAAKATNSPDKTQQTTFGALLSSKVVIGSLNDATAQLCQGCCQRAAMFHDESSADNDKCRTAMSINQYRAVIFVDMNMQHLSHYLALQVLSVATIQYSLRAGQYGDHHFFVYSF